MAKNFGKMHYRMIEYQPTVNVFNNFTGLVTETPVGPKERYGVMVNEDDVLWYDLTKDIPQDANQWFIAVREEDGWIFSAETDPHKLSLIGVDFWQIEHPGPATQIRGNIWDGEKIVETEWENPA